MSPGRLHVGTVIRRRGAVLHVEITEHNGRKALVIEDVDGDGLIEHVIKLGGDSIEPFAALVRRAADLASRGENES